MNDSKKKDQENSMQPFIKWAGGKRQLLDDLHRLEPSEYNTYYEPFVGGGAFFLSIDHPNIIINDSNDQLINCYIKIRDEVETVLQVLAELDSLDCNAKRYLNIREKYNNKIIANIHDAESAALLIWLNKHCFNGLYRTNKKGLFNVPYNGKVKCESVDKENLMNIHTYLQDISINCADYTEICKNAKSGDFLFFDPPYVPVGKYGDFKRYTKEQFYEKDQIALANLVKKLANRGCYVMLTNSNHPLVHELYSDFKIEIIPTKRNISSNGNSRTGEDVIVTTYL